MYRKCVFDKFKKTMDSGCVDFNLRSLPLWFKRGGKALRYLHISRNIERYLERLRMNGKQGALAASQYLQIIE